MFVVLGASGHTGAVVANALLDRGQQVRTVARNVEHLTSLTKRGAEPIAADATNPTALNNAFKGAEAAYVLIPPNVSTNDVRGFQERVSDAIAAAVRAAGLKTVVALSSIGAESRRALARSSAFTTSNKNSMPSMASTYSIFERDISWRTLSLKPA